MERMDDSYDYTNVLHVLPELKGEEMVYIQSMLKDMDRNQALTFASAYRARRKDPQIILLTALIGLIWIAGVHRFLMGQIGMGILYLFTGGLCWIGTIVDLVNHERLALEHNMSIAQELKATIRV